MERASLPDLAERLQAACLERGLTVATAESCTGGLVAGAITAVDGSSGYFLGGVVAYANSAKEALLGVTPQALEAHGAVSAQVARAMAVAAVARTGATLAVSITGVAGPGGGTRAKPVGLTYVAVAHPWGVDVRRFAWPGDRAANRDDSVRAALEMLLEWAEAQPLPAAEAAAPDDRGATSAEDPA
jgi:nicotinamide-nucleotide amidase